MISRRAKDYLDTIVEAGLTVAVLVLLFFTAGTSYVTVLSFVLTGLLAVFFICRYRWRVRQAVRRMTDEITKLPEDLSEKEYDIFQRDTRIFFEELTRVRRLLDKRSQNRQELLDIVNTVASSMEFSGLLRDLMPRLNEATRSSCSAFYVVNSSSNKLEIKHSIGFSKNIYREFDLTLGEGLIGKAAVSKEVTFFTDIPEDTIYLIRTFLGKIKPRSLIVVPVYSQEALTGILVCASIYEYTREDREMIELIKYYLGVAVNNGENYEKTKRLTSELTFQNKLIQDQYEEMKKWLSEKTQLLNYFVNKREDCIYVLDENGTVLVWSQGVERLFHISGHTAIGKPIERLMEEQRWPSVTKQYQSAKKNGSYIETFWRSNENDDNFLYELTMNRMTGDKNESIGILCQLRQIIS